MQKQGQEPKVGAAIIWASDNTTIQDFCLQNASLQITQD